MKLTKLFLVSLAVLLVSTLVSRAETEKPKRVPHEPLKPGEIRTLKIKELGNFEFSDIDRIIPDDVKQFDGKTIKLVGVILPTDEAENFRTFLLVPELYGCCFGQPPTVEHTIVGIAADGISEDFASEQVTIIGTLHVKIVTEEGYVVQIFSITDAKIAEM